MTRAEMTDPTMIGINDFLVTIVEKNNQKAMALINQNNGLSAYQMNMIRYQNYETKALILYNAKEFSLAKFYKNLADHYKTLAHTMMEVVVHV